MTLYENRIPTIVDLYSISGANQLNSWLDVLEPNGTFSTVDYTTGCAARAANWPAEVHWINTVSLAAAYINAYLHNASLTDLAPNDFAGNATVKTDLDLAMNWWFANDLTELDCLDEGGVSGFNCPCGTPGMWNTNWFDSVIYVPRPATHTCVLLNATLTTSQRASCVLMGQRSFDTFARYGVFGLGTTSKQSWEAGANILDIASIGVNLGILRYFGGDAAGLDIITNAYEYAHNEVIIQPGHMADGIRPDGTFGQHLGVLYNGNYGFDYIVLILSLELSAADTAWQGNATTISAVETLIDGSQWMIYKNTATDVLHWDISTVGRMISFASSDSGQSTAGIEFNLTQVQQLGTKWNSSVMVTAATDLMNGATSANAENPYGFHLGQGASFTYALGSEYQDIANAWDWSLIPGITTDYQVTPLSCGAVGVSGKRAFVGGASNGDIGVAAMDYINPLTGKFAYRKAWFFFEDDLEHVTVSGIVSNSSAHVYSALDQKRYSGPVYVNGKQLPIHTGRNTTGATSLWHSQIGYVFDNSALDGGLNQLSVSVANRSGSWSAIGISAVTGSPTEELFTALLQHPATNLPAPLAYSVYPGTTSYPDFKTKSGQRNVTTIENDDVASAVLDEQKGVVMVVFWKAWGGSVNFPSLSIASDSGVIVIFNTVSGNLTYADPTQTLQSATVTLTDLTGDETSHDVPLAFGKGLAAGQSVTIAVDGW
ncbi:hypothetical protein FRB98_007817 [Tulasnella sp. 332]|nr:hypothetical protein FRB98_007817 [Tulasnella sp. 332]